MEEKLSEVNYPKIYLAIDNCFAYKRWTRPIDWAGVIKDLGIMYVEASADTELDPLYMGEEYLKRWIRDVKHVEDKIGIRIANLYSGHGTYTTLGLTHTDMAVRERFIKKWFEPMIDAAAALSAGFGFLVHAFPEFVLQDRELYAKYLQELYANIARINTSAKEKGCKYLALEQMYSPQMPPWTMEGMTALMEEVQTRSRKEFYFTEDVGHHHKKFVKPTRESIRKAFCTKRERGIWLGSENAFAIYFEALRAGVLEEKEMTRILEDIDNNPHMFTQSADNDCYEWLGRLGCYAPIVHLQQTNGEGSKHLAFTEENNKTGVVDGAKVLRALKQSYDKQLNKNVKRCEKIYLTLELFSAASETSNDVLYDYEKSVAYWRNFVPSDGMDLGDLVEMFA